VERGQVIKLLRRFSEFAKAHIESGAQQGRLDAAWILSERFVAVLNGQFVFALLSKNLRANEERWPQFGIVASAASTLRFAPATSPFLS
jgi:hypothetical protein